MQVHRRRLVTPDVVLDARAQTVVGQTIPKFELERNRAKPRSRDLLDAIGKLDTATDPKTMGELAGWIKDQYEARGGGALLGLFGHCYLGGGHIDHRMDLTGQIVQHYKADELPPPVFVPARPLAVSTAYLFIEVYADGAILPIRPDGTSAI